METIIIFDWDDTLLATTFIHTKNYELDNIIDEDFFKLGQLVYNVLNTAMTFGKVLIVTSAEENWVWYSAKKFLPNIIPILEKITIISAKTFFEKMAISDSKSPSVWKYVTFKQLIGDNTHLLSFGDSEAEREAVKNTSPLIGKSVKFIVEPTIIQLKIQLEIIINQFEFLFNYNGHLDLKMEYKN